MFQLNRYKETKEIIQQMLNRDTVHDNREVDSLPGEIQSVLLTNDGGIPYLLLIVKNELAMKEGHVPVNDLHMLLELLWKQHAIIPKSSETEWNDLMYRIERDLCTCWMQTSR